MFCKRLQINNQNLNKNVYFYQLLILNSDIIKFEVLNMQPTKIIGYAHLLIQTMASKDINKNVKATISLGQIAKVDTSCKKSGQNWNQVFLIQVPQQPSRLIILCKSDEQIIGQCRYDVGPFIKHAGLAHSIQSDLYDSQNTVQGNIKLKLTYFSAQHGQLKIRIFHMSLIPTFVQKFKTGKVKVKLGIHMQSTPQQSLSQNFDHTVQLVILMPTMNLTFDVVNDEGILATYTIYNLQKSNLLQDQSKAYQVSLFNNDKPAGMIKYQIDWIKPK